MSAGVEIPLPAAKAWARRLRNVAGRAAERAVIVGSVRRERDTVGDLELLVEPSLSERRQGDMFGSAETFYDTQAVVDALLEDDDGRAVVKAGPRFAQLRLGDHPALEQDRPNLDVFFCHPPASWGALLTIRTGPAALGKYLVTRLREKGWRNHRGAVWRPWGAGDYADAGPGKGEVGQTKRIDGDLFIRVPTPDEEAYFEACEVEYVPPERRDDLVENLRTDGRL